MFVLTRWEILFGWSRPRKTRCCDFGHNNWNISIIICETDIPNRHCFRKICRDDFNFMTWFNSYFVRSNLLSRKSWAHFLELLINLEMYTPYTSAALMLLYRNWKLTIGKLASSVLFFTYLLFQLLDVSQNMRQTKQ